MNFPALILLAVVSAPVDSSSSPAAQTPPSQSASTLRGDRGRKSAIKIADSWLKLVDTDQFGPAWEQSATWFQTGLRKDLWEQNGAAARRPLGKLVARKLTSSR